MGTSPYCAKTEETASVILHYWKLGSNEIKKKHNNINKSNRHSGINCGNCFAKLGRWSKISEETVEMGMKVQEECKDLE